MTTQFTPLKRHHDTILLLPGHAGGFCLAGCPNPKALAEFIETACNAHAVLLEYFKASVAFADCFHEQCTAEDERRAEERFDAAGTAAHKLNLYITEV